MIKALAKMRGSLFIMMSRLQGKKISIDNGLLVYKRLKIVGPGKVVIGSNCIIDGIRGDNSQYVTIDTHSSSSEIVIGKNVSLYAARVSSTHQVTIGNNCLIEESSITDTDFHSIDKDRGDPINESIDKCQIKIGNNVCIGAKSFVLKGVTIGDNSIVMPGSVVSLPVRTDSVVLGNPARPIKSS